MVEIAAAKLCGDDHSGDTGEKATQDQRDDGQHQVVWRRRPSLLERSRAKALRRLRRVLFALLIRKIEHRAPTRLDCKPRTQDRISRKRSTPQHARAAI